jgi:hypothetical protein
MEKVTIKEVKDTGRISTTGSPIIAITLSDGRVGTAYTKDALSWSGEIELEVKAGKPPLPGGQQYYNFFIPSQTNKKAFPQKDYKFEKRNASLAHAISFKHISNTYTPDDIVAMANKFYDYLNS